MPATVPYRQAVEEFTNYRLDVVKTTESVSPPCRTAAAPRGSPRRSRSRARA